MRFKVKSGPLPDILRKGGPMIKDKKYNSTVPDVCHGCGGTGYEEDDDSTRECGYCGGSGTEYLP